MTTNITIPSCRSGTDKASPSSWADAVKGRMKFQIVGMSPICRRTLVARWAERLLFFSVLYTLLCSSFQLFVPISQVLQYVSHRKHFYFGRAYAYKLWTRIDLERLKCAWEHKTQTDRDATNYLNSTDAKLTPQKWAPNLFYWNSHIKVKCHKVH